MDGIQLDYDEWADAEERGWDRGGHLVELGGRSHFYCFAFYFAFKRRYGLGLVGVERTSV